MGSSYNPPAKRASSRMVVATHADCAQGNNNLASDGGVSDGIITTQTSRRKHFFQTSCKGVRLVFMNAVNDCTSAIEQSAAVDPFTIKCGFEDSSGNIFKVLFGGLQTVTLQPGSVVVSDPIAREFAAGDFAWQRPNVTVASGKVFPLNSGHWGGASGEAVESGSDKSYSGTISGGGFAFSAVAVVGESTTAIQPPCLCGIGDSIMWGNLSGTPPGGSITTNSTANGTGPLLRALGFPWGANTPCIQLGFSGDTMQSLASYALSPLRIQMMQLAGTTHVVCNMGFNDIFNASRTAVQVKADMLTFWNRMATLGIPVWQIPITPKSASTDNFATSGNISVSNPTAEIVRQDVNAYIRTIPAPLAGVIDWAAAVESATTPGVHKTTGQTYGVTADGSHLSQGGDILAAAAINLSIFG